MPSKEVTTFLWFYLPFEGLQLLLIVPLLLDVSLFLKILMYFTFMTFRQSMLYAGYLIFTRQSLDQEEHEPFRTVYPTYVTL